MSIYPLLTTKLTLPPRRVRMLDRQVLRQRLDEVKQHQLTLLSAPAGFGKTTLLAGWAATCGEKVAWISLDDSENDPLLFWHYFAAACQQIQPDLERLIAPVRPPSGPLDVDALLSVLINTLAHASSPLLLILDDYHLVTTHKIHQQMTFLIEHLPAALHLVISTRADPPFPLARFRARNMLNELRTLDLRFSEEETVSYLKQELGLTLMMPSMLATIEQKLEGWPAGLHLLALSLKNRPDRLQWLAAWNGQHHHMATYLIEEVLLQQPAEIQEFLLCTSLLPRLTGSLCDALLERSDSTGILELLAGANLFLTALDEEHTWYRYHHLFAEVLKHRLTQSQGKERIAQLCRRARSWYVQHQLLLDAVEAAVLAEDYEEAAALLEQQGIPVAQGYPYTRFIAWIEQFPAAVLTQYPDLANWYASALLMSGRLDKLTYAGEAAAQGFEIQGNLSSQGVMLAFNAIRSYWTGNGSAFTTLCARALPLLADHAPASPTLTILNGFAALQQGRVRTARPLFRAWLRIHEQIPTFTGHIAGCTMGYADILWMQGQLQEAAALYQQVIARVKVLPFPTSEAHFRWSKVLLEWNRLAEAQAVLERALQQARWMQHSKLLSLGATQQARLSLAHGEMAQAENALQEALHLADVHHHHYEARREALIVQGWLVLRQEDEKAFEQWSMQMEISSESSPTFAQEQAFLLLARWLIAHQQADQVLELLPRWREAAAENGRELVVMQCSLVQVLAHAARQERTLALRLLEQTLRCAEPGGFVRLFLDEGQVMQGMLSALSRQIDGELPYLQILLAAFPQTASTSAVADTADVPFPPTSVHTHLEPLSPREGEVLRLIAQGATNEEIAAQLVIAYTTVKRHVSTILSKLDAANRTQAVARAREQGWLSSEM